MKVSVDEHGEPHMMPAESSHEATNGMVQMQVNELGQPIKKETLSQEPLQKRSEHKKASSVSPKHVEMAEASKRKFDDDEEQDDIALDELEAMTLSASLMRK